MRISSLLKVNAMPSQPRRLFFLAMFTIFIAEMIDYMTLATLPAMPSYLFALLDSVFLIVLLFFPLSMLVLKPLTKQINNLNMLTEEKNKLIDELNDTISEVKTLRGIIPICAYCKKIRDDGQYWQQLEEYISNHSEAKFSHGICPDCYELEIKKMEVVFSIQELSDIRTAPEAQLKQRKANV